MSLTRRDDNFSTMPFFNDFFTRDVWNWGLSNNSTTNTTIPSVNIKENNEHFEVEMAAPGMNKEDFRINLDNNILTISSEKQNHNEEKDSEKISRREFSYESFQRTFHLPKEVVDSEKIQAKYENGVLRLLIPKREEAKQKPPRMIQIS